MSDSHDEAPAAEDVPLPSMADATSEEIAGAMEVLAAAEEADEGDRIDRELNKIRVRRNKEERRFPVGIEDYTLMFGLMVGMLFFGSTFAMSTGMIVPDSVAIDERLSGTFLDPGEKCQDSTGQVWVKVWIDDVHNIRLTAFNTPEDISTNLTWSFSGGEESGAESAGGSDYIVNKSSKAILTSSIPDGEFELTLRYYNVSFDEEGNVSDIRELIEPKTVAIKVHTREAGPISKLQGNHEGVKEAEVLDDGPRVCWTMQQIGGWAWILMLAEWGGGRETAMLSGGSAGIPPWWMASVSLFMSVFFLFVQYPLMYRFYHREEDDELSEAQLARVVQRAIEKASDELHIRVDWDAYRIQEREISVDVLVPYATTPDTYGDRKDVRAEIVRGILEEFQVFGIMKPLQLKVNPVDERSGVFSALIEGMAAEDISITEHGERKMLVEDYSDFFENLNTYASLESRAQDAMRSWYRSSNLVDCGTAVASDDRAVFVRVIYRPRQRFAFFRFKRSFQDVEGEIEQTLAASLADIIGDRRLVVSARNQVSTLSDRSAAGRVETGTDTDNQALVAKQEGIAGTLLQTAFMGDILSTVEFVAQENRSKIDRYGFWGLIVFVWIPFMASGVLVGAMLGLLSRMSFERVLAACMLGGTAASITWAYTARGIIELMEKYHAEAFLPFLIALVVVLAIMHLRTNKKRRQEALFRESLAFFGGDSQTE